MMEKIWKGRFSKQLDDQAHDFNASIAIDSRMAAQDIKGSLAHAAMLGAQGILTQGDVDAIAAGLEGILNDLERGTLEIDRNAEDIHSFVEAELTARIGAPGKMLHTARSRNDQVALDVRLYLREYSDEIVAQLRGIIETLCAMAHDHAATVMPGYTHMQRAQPITFGHHLMAYAMMFLRDIGRMQDARRRMNMNPLGSAALAGTTYPIDRAMTAQALGFDDYARNSIDGVSDRDFAIEYAAALSAIMLHLSRFCEEIILWCSWEFKFVELDEGFSTGSSIMPQKKNPDIAELVRGKTGRVYGDLIALLTALKGLPLAYNKDMQEDKQAIFDAFDTVRACLEVFTPMLATMRPLEDNMRAAAARGFTNATDCADYLVRQGEPFRSAYQIVGALVAQCVARGCALEELTLAEFQAASPLFKADIYEAIDLLTCVEKRVSPGGTSPQSVEAQIHYVKEALA